MYSSHAVISADINIIFGPIVSGLCEQHAEISFSSWKSTHIQGAMYPSPPEYCAAGPPNCTYEENFMKRLYLRRYILEIYFVAATC